MSTHPRRKLTLALAGALLAVPATADAGPPGSWTKVTGVGFTARTIDEVGAARTPDGVLHVIYKRPPAQIEHRAVSADARSVLSPNPVASFPLGANHRPALISVPGGLRAFFAGNGNPQLGTRMATAASTNGQAWAVQPFPASNNAITNSHKPFAAAGIGAAQAGGLPAFAWGDADPGSGGYHFGLSPTTPDFDFPDTVRCCEVDPNLAVDGRSGQLVLGWNSLRDDAAEARSLSPAGGVTRIPNSGARQLGQRVAMTGRIGAPGIYVGYTAGRNPFSGRVALWRFGSSRARILSSAGRRARFTSVAAAPAGRLWLFWMRNRQLYAARSNKSATRFGAHVKVRPPRGTDSIWRLAGDGSRGPLDLLAHLSRSGSDVGTWHQRILPRLSVSVKVRNGKATVKVTDASATVFGATVRVAGRTKTTGKSGKVRYSLGAGRYRARVAKAGYTSNVRRFRVR
jgi:hypothetical protein